MSLKMKTLTTKLHRKNNRKQKKTTQQKKTTFWLKARISQRVTDNNIPKKL